MRLTVSVLASFIFMVRGNPVNQEVTKREPYGYFTSPNYPEQYDNDDRREWRILVREGYHVKFRFTSFDLEDSYEEENGPCVYDYVLITEGTETIGRFCGNADEFPWDAPRTNDWFHTKGKEARVVFVSDYSNEGISPTGFSFHYVEEDNDECAEMRYKSQHTLEDWDELIVCDHFCNNIPGSYYCSCRNGYVLHENEHTCVAIDNCVNQTFTTDDGVIESPDYPNAYAKLSQCSWDIQVRDGLSILLEFDTNFGVEEHDVERCVYDILKVNDVSYCGMTAPNNGSVIDMNTRHVSISFTTDLSVELQGFRIVYNTSRIRCNLRLSNPSHGRITSVNSKGYYEFEDKATFKCDTGYELKGSSTLECLSDGSWNTTQPRCQIKSCGAPDHLLAVKNSHIIDRDAKRFEYGERVTVKCDDWYEMTAGVATWRCTDTKEWVRESTSIAPNPPADYPKCRPICGKKKSRVRRGASVETEENEFPWIVFLSGTPSLSGDGCTGSLISSRYVLTAAHCLHVEDRPDVLKPTHVWIGVHDRTANEQHVEYASAENIILYPRYKADSKWDYDIALIRLNRTITMNNRMRPICLPSSPSQMNLVRPNVTGVVSGWSLYSDVTDSSLRLLKGDFPVVREDTCWTSFEDKSAEMAWTIPDNVAITDSMFCAGYEDDAFSSTCNGDSGSPFMKEQYRKVYALGLVSWGLQRACEQGRKDRIISYTVYARLDQAVVDWIGRETNGLE